MRFRHDLAEAFDLTFGLKVNRDPRAVLAPFFQPSEKLIALRLGDDELADAEIANLAIDKCAAEIFGAADAVIQRGAKRSRRLPLRYVNFLQRNGKPGLAPPRRGCVTASASLGMTSSFSIQPSLIWISASSFCSGSIATRK